MMFACIFFYEDKSLSVVGEKSKKLELMESFKEGGKVKMNWGKVGMFSGCIVKVHENEELLNIEAIKAEKKILRGKEFRNNEERVEALLNYFKKATEKPAALKKDGKRERTTTERAKESKEQDLEMSPKKRKKIQKENEKEEKNHEGSESTSEGKKKEPSKEGKKRKNEKEDMKKISEMNPKEKEKKEKRAESNVELLAAKEILASPLCSQFDDISVDSRSPAVSVNGDTPLTSTWALCNPDLQNHRQMDIPVTNDRPSDAPIFEVPPADVICLFELMLKPNVQKYMKAIVEQAKEQSGQTVSNYQMADKPYTCNTLPQELPTLTSQTSGWTPYSNYTQPTPWSNHVTYTPEQTSNMPLDAPALTLKTPTKQISTCHTQFQHFTPLQDATLMSNRQSFLPTNNIPPQNTNTQSLENTNIPSLQIQSVSLQNTVTQPLQNTTMASPPSTTSFTTMSPQTTLPATPRRSPRKHCTTPEAADGHMTKLLASYSLSVRREALRKAKEAAKKGNPSKMGFTMTAKLLPAIFTWEELASSRGQGLKSKEGDTRPVLDVSKMTILKEYVAVWCQQNGGQGSYAEKDVNDAVTEQVSYARKKMKSKTSKS